MSINDSIESPLQAATPLVLELVKCLHCAQQFPPDDFEITKTVKGKIYRRRKCRQCKRQTQKNRIHNIARWVSEYKKTLQCRRCGVADYRVLTFHHRDANSKSGNVADMSGRGWSLRQVQEEIEKCEILCANCHLIEHFEAKREKTC